MHIGGEVCALRGFRCQQGDGQQAREIRNCGPGELKRISVVLKLFCRVLGALTP